MNVIDNFYKAVDELKKVGLNLRVQHQIEVVQTDPKKFEAYKKEDEKEKKKKD